MGWFSRPRRARGSAPILAVEKLDVYYGRAHALQEVSLSLEHGVTAVVGRNGMGKTTLCNAITGLVPASGSVRLAGEEILGLPPNAITSRGVGYVPQGRRVWPSLTVDEHLRLASRDRLAGAWTVARVYQTFPRLAERKGNGGAELSGGEQQMLAIARALLFNPILLVMDEPTEGLAPVIVEQVAEMLKRLAADGEISVLLIEQNLGVAIDVADTVDVMVNGRIARSMPSAELAADRDLQQRLLGVKVGGDAEPDGRARRSGPGSGRGRTTRHRLHGPARDRRRRAGDRPRARAARRAHGARFHPVERGRSPERAARPARRAARRSGRAVPSLDAAAAAVAESGRTGRVVELPGRRHHRARGLRRRHLRHQGARALLPPEPPGEARGADGHGRPGDVRQAVAGHDPSPGGRAAPSAGRARRVHGRPRLRRQRDGGGVRAVRPPPARPRRPHLGRRLRGHRAGHAGDARAPHRRAQAHGVLRGVRRREALRRPVRHLHDVLGHRRRRHQPDLGARPGQRGPRDGGHDRPRARPDGESGVKPAIGLTQFGNTTPCVQAVTKALEERYDCLVFHATGTGGQSMEKLVDSGLLAGVIDATTTEIADEIVGGVLSAGPGGSTRSSAPGCPTWARAARSTW